MEESWCRMSYEGYEQRLCQNGHLSEHECDDRTKVCNRLVEGNRCGQNFVMINEVDQTNCDAYGIIPPSEWAKILISDVVFKECEHCKHRAIFSDARYKLPTPEQAQHMRHYQPEYGGTEYVRLDNRRKKLKKDD